MPNILCLQLYKREKLLFFLCFITLETWLSYGSLALLISWWISLFLGTAAHLFSDQFHWSLCSRFQRRFLALWKSSLIHDLRCFAPTVKTVSSHLCCSVWDVQMQHFTRLILVVKKRGIQFEAHVYSIQKKEVHQGICTKALQRIRTTH